MEVFYGIRLEAVKKIKGNNKMKTDKITLLHWGIVAIIICAITLSITVIMLLSSKKKEKEEEEKATAHAIVVSETMTNLTKTTAANMEAMLNELEKMKPLQPGETE